VLKLFYLQAELQVCIFTHFEDTCQNLQLYKQKNDCGQSFALDTTVDTLG